MCNDFDDNFEKNDNNETADTDNLTDENIGLPEINVINFGEVSVNKYAIPSEPSEQDISDLINSGNSRNSNNNVVKYGMPEIP